MDAKLEEFYWVKCETSTYKPNISKILTWLHKKYSEIKPGSFEVCGDFRVYEQGIRNAIVYFDKKLEYSIEQIMFTSKFEVILGVSCISFFRPEKYCYVIFTIILD